MKILKFLKLFLLLMILASCSSLSGFAPKKGATGEEFLIQKKNALVMPPDYNDLPVPSSEETKSSEQYIPNIFFLPSNIPLSPGIFLIISLL